MIDARSLTGMPEEELPPAPPLSMIPQAPAQQAQSNEAVLGILKLCPHCGGYHPCSCPYIEEMSFHDNGMIATIRFSPQRLTDLKEKIFNSPKEISEAIDWVEIDEKKSE